MGRVGGPDPQDLLTRHPARGSPCCLLKARGAGTTRGSPTPTNQAMGGRAGAAGREGAWSRTLTAEEGPEHRARGRCASRGGHDSSSAA